MRLLIVLCGLLSASTAIADDYNDARAELVAAYQAGDYAAMRAAAAAALVARPEYPGALFNKALAEVLDDDLDAAMATLGRLVEKLAVPATASDYGIDGLYRHGNRLIAIQNGIRPHRVTAFALADDGLAVESAEILAMNLPEFDEPTLGTIVGDDLYFVANSHWNRFDADNNLPDDLSGPIVLKLDLSVR